MKDTLAKLLAEGGHEAHLEALTALIQPTIRVTATQLARRPEGWRRAGEDVDTSELVEAMEKALAALPLGASRFGGVPDLPQGAAWPERDGVPMEFIAQLRLADASGLDPDSRLPTEGSLLFFHNSQWATSDMEPDAACAAVLFHDGPDSELVRAAPPRVEWQSEFSDVPQTAPMIHGLASLSFAKSASLPGGVSPYVDDELGEFWQDFECDHFEALYGDVPEYADNRLLGYVGGQDYVEAHENGADDQLLLQVDSDDAADFQFGDCDRLYFILTKAQLAAREFDKARVYSMLG